MRSNILENADQDFLDKIHFGNRVLQKINSNILESIELLEIRHVRHVMIEILHAYLNDKLLDWELLEFVEIAERVLYEKYRYDYPETSYPLFHKSDKRSLGINCLNYLDFLGFQASKEDALFFIDFLKSKNPSEAHKKLASYLHGKYPSSKSWIKSQ